MNRKIVVCMGSSCFSRGNQGNLEYILDFLVRHNLSMQVELRGSRCENKCSIGPLVHIDGKQYVVRDHETLEMLLRRELLETMAA
ncbi:MAG TPA: (2Fe-2S) ferredoxin domain-containing protein [Candidatus Ozemobacteraceae bacterium]|nr:(2Fe-2S) ferredoxin domain-containing protein [Candidatus Ozemobacteraceae bacterium]